MRAASAMSDTPVSLLLIDDGTGPDAWAREAAGLTGYGLTHAGSLAEGVEAAGSGRFQIVLLDPGPGPEPGLDALRRIKELAPDAEIIVVAAMASLASAIRSYELAAFAYLQKPVDGAQLIATIDRALERRRIALYNRRLFWELQTINEIADGTSRSLELDAVLGGALQRVVRAFDALAGSIRLRDDLAGRFEVRAWAVPGSTAEEFDAGTLDRPFSDRVIASRASVIVEDLAADACGGGARGSARSALSVPMLAGNDLVGTLTVAAAQPHRFDLADERLLGMIGGQILVAVQNARLHDSVRRAKREWEGTFDAIGDPIAVFDRAGVLLRGNAALAACADLAVTALRYSTCSEIGFCGGGCPSCAVGRALVEGEASSDDITRPDGQIFSVTTFPVRGTGGVSVVQVAKNVTDRIRSARQLQQMSDEIALANAQLVATLDQLKSTQAQLLQAEKLSAIGQLVSGVAHELNNPLTSVIGYAQLLEAELRDPGRVEAPRAAAELASDLRHISDEAERAARIVRNLLSFARRQTTARAPQDVADLVGRVLSLRSYHQRLNDIALATEFEPGLPELVADGGQLQQALLNLILNAEQAMRNRPERRLTVGARLDEAGSAVEIFVSDTGHGIAPANVSRVFDPFFTTRDVGEGTGLGLSICYGIVRDHGGEIAVTTRVDAGTTFWLRLPARVEPVRVDAREILVGHAEPSEREFLAAALAAWGYRVAAVARADEALARYREGRLSAAVVGWGTLSPHAAEWAAELADRRAVSPLILLGLSSADGETERFARAHAAAVLVPPFQLRPLWSAVRAIEQQKEYA